MAETDTSPAALRALANLVEHLLDSVDQCIIVKDEVTDCNMVSDTLRALAAEKEAGAPASAPDGWIPWEGGECPVAQHVSVDVKFRTGDIDPCYPAAGFDWSHGEQDPHDDIIAYRLSKEG